MASTCTLDSQPPLHESLKHVSWLLGKWRGEGCGVYPTISPFSYKEEIIFGHVGQPMLTYKSETWTIENNAPMHSEMGFMRIKPGTSTVAFVITQSNGLAEVEEGEVVLGEKIHFVSNSISRMTFGTDPRVLKVERVYKLLDPNTLELCCFMETSNTDLQKHLHITYKKVTE